ncbi:MAG: hypothetical protein IT442_12320, partial [Phycisphaeraceae bacterium]|nr:hypothetical protein [Phycisphaeraceae bacterium]
DWALTFLAGSSLNDFLAQPNLLQTPGYDVERMPELGWWQVGRSLLDDRLTYYGQTQASRLRVLTDETTPGQRGFTAAQSMDLFGIGQDTRFEDAVLGMGVPDDSVLRLDSRHEVQAPVRLLIFDVVPYAAGRVTAYDTDFSGFSSGADYVRLWGTAGVRVGTEFSRGYESVNLPLLDVHGIRHIFEPTTELFMTGSTVSPGAYPVYDPDVEGISDAWGVRIGGRNTLQTRRGGPGRWRTVDWITFDNTLSVYGNEPNPGGEVPVSLGYRPEYGMGGDNLSSRLMWMVSDTFALSGEQTYGLYDQEVERWRVGMQIDHSPEVSTHVDYVHIPDLDQSLLVYGLRYRMSAKYRMLIEHTLDLDGPDISRQIDVGVERLLARSRVRVQASFNQVDNEQSVVILLIPEGISARGDRQWDTPAGGP